jgi:choline monooxygenase
MGRTDLLFASSVKTPPQSFAMGSLKQLIESYDPNVLLSEASTPSSSWYTDPLVLALEQRTVFSRSWQMIGRAKQLRELGQYITGELAGERMLVVRGHDDILRGFYNVCRHHAAAVMTESQGQVDHLRCPYHGWTYNLEGALIVAPEFGGVCNFDKAINGLIPVQTAIWHGWVFVKLDSDGPSLEKFFGNQLIGKFEGLNLKELHWSERRSYTVNCNWKVFVDNYLDGGYHVPHIHGALNSVLDYGEYKIATGERFCVQSSPIISGKADAETAEVRKGDRAYYFWIYPNFMINWYEGVMDTNLVVPCGIDRTEVIFDYYFTDVSEGAREKNLASIAVSERIQNEDVAICESVQRGLASRAYSAGRLSVRREAGEHLFHRLLYADLKSGLSNDAGKRSEKSTES